MIQRLLSISIILLAFSAAYAQRDFVTVADGRLQLNRKPYRFVGTNYWYGSLLGLEKDGRRGIKRMRHELDFLKKNGVTNLRLMAGAEGSGMINGVMRVGPPLQPEKGRFDDRALDGLDIVLAEMEKRGIKAVIFLSNNWEWSGGFQQYLIWNGRASEDLLTRKRDWDELRDVVSRFYSCEPCKRGYIDQVRFVLSRTNKIKNRRYVDDPTIMAWELANEPRPMRPAAREAYVGWISETAKTIKTLDKHHLVTTGHEGWIGTEGMELFEEIHRDPNIDYLTIHIWPKNWQWYESGKLAEQFGSVVGKTTAYIDEHIIVAKRLNKPLVIEEFGLPRDEVRKKTRSIRESETGQIQSPKSKIQNLAPGTSTRYRDNYFRAILAYVGKGPIAGANFWAFGGSARPIPYQTFWKPGDEWMGDPPMEEQGLNTVFDIDASTWRVIREAARAR